MLYSFRDLLLLTILNVVERALDFGHFRLDCLLLPNFICLASFLLLSRQEGPIEELHRDLDVVLELTLGELIPCD